MSRRRCLVPLAVLILGVPLLLAASVVDDSEPVGSILDDPDPTARALAGFRASTGYSGELIARTKIGSDGVAITVVRPVLFPSPFSGCTDIEDCEERITKACLDVGAAGVKKPTVKVVKNSSCSGQCAGLEIVYVEVSCPSPEPAEPPKPKPQRPSPEGGAFP